MEHDIKPSELKLTEEEIGRFTKAFKDEKFRKMLRDYAEEISDPDNRKKYEEEIAILEKERGNNVQFIHPTPFQCIRTSVNGKNKCYVNICANDKIGKPSCKLGQSQDGATGHHWSLPHSLHPERKELDPKGNKIFIYDVIFHPDTLHMATTNNRFMDMVTSVAIQSIQDGFNVSLDKNNTKNMTTKYKGNPKACVIRKPITGFKAKEATDDPDPLAFPYPDDKATISKKEETKKSLSKPLDNSQGPTKPHYTLKYRSFVDLQDFRCSRDSGPSTRPKEIVLTIDLPLLKSVADIHLEVEERSLLLESEKPDYKLELSLAYGVDEDKGAAKFNKQTRQLLVTLPVRPPGKCLQLNSSGPSSAEDTQCSGGVFEKSEVEQDDSGHPNEEKAAESQENTAAEETKDMSQRDEEDAEVGIDISLQNGTKMEEHRGGDEFQQIGHVIKQVQSCEKKQVRTVAEEENVQENENPKIPNGDNSSEEKAQNNTAVEETKDMSQRDEENAEVGNDLSLQDGTKIEEMHQFVHEKKPEVQSCEKKQVEAEAVEENAQAMDNKQIQISKSEKAQSEKASEDHQGDSGDITAAEEEHKELQKPETDFVSSILPPVLLREVREDGSQRVISDHVTTAGFSIYNSLMFELD
ncbi:unnamed protein product [Knipowitschia caucasica]